MADRVSDDARIWVAREWADEQILTIPLGSKAEVQEWLDGQLDDVDGRPVVITAKDYRANVLAGAEEHAENLLRYAVARFVDESPAQDGPPSDWQQQLSEVAEQGRFEAVARLIDGWRQAGVNDCTCTGQRVLVIHDPGTYCGEKQWDQLGMAASEAVQTAGWDEATPPAGVAVAVEGVVAFLRGDGDE